MLDRNKPALKLSEVRKATPDGPGAWAEAMRAACFDGASEGDLRDIMQAQVTKAKAGDTKAASFVVGYLTAGPKRSAGPDAGPVALPPANKPPSAAKAAKAIARLRRLLALHLLQSGPATPDRLREDLDVSGGALTRAADCGWFTVRKGFEDRPTVIALTDFGRIAVAPSAPAVAPEPPAKAPTKALSPRRDETVPDAAADFQATPEEVAADQRAAVVEAVGAIKAGGGKLTAEAISEATVLPPSIVRQRLKELGVTL